MPDLSGQLADIQRTLGHLQGTCEAIKEGMERGTERMDGHDTRLGKVEHKVTWFSGVAATVGALVGWGVQWFIKTQA